MTTLPKEPRRPATTPLWLLAILCVIALATVGGFFIWFMSIPFDGEPPADTTPLGKKMAHQAALAMDAAAVEGRPYPSAKQMVAGIMSEWSTSEITVVSSNAAERTYCITTLPDEDFGTDPVRYYVARTATTPVKSPPEPTTTPCN